MLGEGEKGEVRRDAPCEPSAKGARRGGDGLVLPDGEQQRLGEQQDGRKRDSEQEQEERPRLRPSLEGGVLPGAVGLREQRVESRGAALQRQGDRVPYRVGQRCGGELVRAEAADEEQVDDREEEGEHRRRHDGEREAEEVAEVRGADAEGGGGGVEARRLLGGHLWHRAERRAGASQPRARVAWCAVAVSCSRAIARGGS
mmetsp:Transcript_8825/g.27847  ORF Transcript_8825/g.27847 Transcript_8825/m.27847 type:complete len:201 (+) Transcript_8825:487-1089(+)